MIITFFNLTSRTDVFFELSSLFCFALFFFLIFRASRNKCHVSAIKETRDRVETTFFSRSKPCACLVRSALGSRSPEKHKKKKSICFIRHRVKYGLDDFLDYFWTIYWTLFLDNFVGGGKHTISTQGGVGCSISVRRKGWEAVLLLREGWERDYY